MCTETVLVQPKSKGKNSIINYIYKPRVRRECEQVMETCSRDPACYILYFKTTLQT